MCGRACSFPNAGATCSAGVCGLGSCNTGFANCDGMAANGCEVSTATSGTNCGSCSNVCMLPHALPSCAGGMCTATTCSSGYNDCNATAADGCETNCGNGRTCTGASCTPGWLTLASMGAPTARAYTFSAIATSRHELIVWGGRDLSGYFNNGARYNWDTNTWAPMAAAPAGLTPRAYGNAVWTGTEFVVWGGRNATNSFANGALYNPQSDSWRAIAMDANTPSVRSGYTAVWTGSAVLVEGGQDLSGNTFSDGGVYTISSMSWRHINSGTVSTARTASAWTGTRLAVFGGTTDTACGSSVRGDDTMSLLDPSSGTGSWAVQTITSHPTVRYFESLIDCVPYAWPAVWTGTDIVIFGGIDRAAYVANGARWHPGDAAYRAIAAPPAPLSSNGFLPVLVWTGSRVFGWSEAIAGSVVNVAYTYDPVLNNWTQSVPAGAPPAVYEGAAFGWTGNELIVWGGRTGTSTVSNQGGRLAP